METTENKVPSPIKVIRESRIIRFIIDFRGVWFALLFLGFFFFGWHLIPYLPFILPGKIEVPYSYPPLSVANEKYTLNLWYPKMIAPGRDYPLIYTVTAKDTTQKEEAVSIENYLGATNTSIQSTPSFNQLKFSFSDELGNQDQKIVNIFLPTSDSAPAEVNIRVTLKTPNGNLSDNLMIPVAQVGWFNYLAQVIFLAISGLATLYSNIQPGFSNIISWAKSLRNFQN